MSLFASEHYVIRVQTPELDIDEYGVNAHNPSKPPESHAILVVYKLHLLLVKHIVPLLTQGVLGRID